MNIREIPEEEYLRLQNLNGFASSLLQNTEAAKLVEKAAKLVNPNIRTPRLDQEAASTAPLTAITESLQKLNQRLDEEKAQRENENAVAAATRQREDGIRRLRQQGWNDTGIAEIEKVMTEKGIMDPVDAAIIFEKRHPAPTPAMPGSAGGFNLAERMHATDVADENVAKLLKAGKDSRAADVIGDKFAMEVLHDIRAQAQR